MKRVLCCESPVVWDSGWGVTKRLCDGKEVKEVDLCVRTCARVGGCAGQGCSSGGCGAGNKVAVDVSRSKCRQEALKTGNPVTTLNP